jgi:signal transduction histidine kinase
VASVIRAGRQRRFERQITTFDAHMILVAIPVGHTGLVVVTGKTLDTVDSAVQRVQVLLLVGGPLLVLAAAAGAWVIAAAALRPVERMRREAEEISDRHSDTTLGVPATKDEVAALARTFNDLLSRLQGALHRQRGFVSAAGHELRTPLTNLQLELELAARAGRTREQLCDAVTAASEEARRLARLAEDLLLLAQSDEGHPPVLPSRQLLLPLLESAAARVREDGHRRGVAVDVSSPPGVEVLVDEVRLRQVLDNLLDNALRFAPSGTTVSVTSHDEEGRVVVEIADAGPGFPNEYLPRAFERFSRPGSSRDRHGGGTGLGLAIAWAIVDAHGGTIGATNDLGGGARVTIRFPAS